ncbi:hypothetical protein BJV74DRAFT_798620 [Russula compacta]|nr:hypothetical protein BJV74DRAFT_798620 [Russula compacta]
MELTNQSCSPTVGPRNATDLWDREIELVTTLVQSLKARRNATLPISMHPPEVLVLMFKSYRDDDGNDLRGRDPRYASDSDDDDAGYYCYKCDRFTPRAIGWLECSRVCQRWRKIIFGTPTLWSDIIVEWGPLLGSKISQPFSICPNNPVSRRHLRLGVHPIHEEFPNSLI